MWKYFNPRSREGSDSIDWEGRVLAIISIHAPARGATSMSTSKSSTISISIHAPARGATHNGKNVEITGKISIHAPARGATM